MDKNKAVKRDVYVGTIDNAVKYLQDAKEKNENIYIDFNGHKIYSADVTLNSAYIEITGKTKIECEKELKEYIKKFEEKESNSRKIAQQKIPEWIKKGKELISPEKMSDWERCINERIKDLYHGAELDSAIEVMKILKEEKSLKKAKEILDSQNHTGASYEITRNIIYKFSNLGPEFWEYSL